jgi:hypothetical protein
VRIVLRVVHDGALRAINSADLKASSDEISLTNQKQSIDVIFTVK